MKIAVGALRLAERHLDVNAEVHLRIAIRVGRELDTAQSGTIFTRSVALPRPVEFAEENSLPAAQLQLAAADEYGCR